MIKISMTFEIDEEYLKELFEGCEVKYSKKKAKELDESLDDYEVKMQLEESFEEIVTDTIQELFEK